jgi:Flp pilus assembly pilin Flp
MGGSEVDFWTAVRNVIPHRSGATALEYCVIATLIIAVILGALSTTDANLKTTYTAVGTSRSTPNR